MNNDIKSIFLVIPHSPTMKPQKKINKNQSVLKDVYVHFGVNNPGELQEVYTEADQELMRSKQWDYKNANLITNQIKDMIEKVGIQNILDKKEKKMDTDVYTMDVVSSCY